MGKPSVVTNAIRSSDHRTLSKMGRAGGIASGAARRRRTRRCEESEDALRFEGERRAEEFQEGARENARARRDDLLEED